MTVALQGQINIAALNVPQSIIQIVAPQILAGGVPTNLSGHVGSASWGPVGLPQIFGNYPQFAQIFGPTVNRANDLGAQVILSCAQGAAFHFGIRATDGTDVAATANAGLMSATGSVTFSGQPSANDTVTIGGTVITFVASGATGNQVNIGADQAGSVAALLAFLQASTDTNISKCVYSASGSVITVTYKTGGTAGNTFTLTKTATNIAVSSATLASGSASTYGLTLTGKYSGSLGNTLKGTIGPGTQGGSYRVVLSMPGMQPEIYDNLAQGLTGNAIWLAIAAAINNGTGGIRPPSGLAVATAGSSTQAPVSAQTTTLSGGTDGASVTTSNLLGTDAAPRKGMYALRGTGCAQFAISDMCDTNAIATMLAFGVDAGMYPIWSSPSADTITNASQTLNTNGVDSAFIKAMFGDWAVWFDTVNNVPQRVSAPAGVVLGTLGNLSPEQNPLNKPIQGIIGTQSTILGKTYGMADFQALATARMDVISNQSPGGKYFSCRLGINTSSNQVTQGDEYPRMTLFLAKSLDKIAGQFIGRTQTPDERLEAKVAFQTFLALLQDNKMIGQADGSQAYQVVLDGTNNTQQTVALGYQFCAIKVVYLGIVRYFIINLEGGASVQISATSPLPTVF